MSGVKGENSLKLFGDDIDTLVAKAGEIRDIMARVPGVADLGVFQESGQPELLVSINRAASARYGLMASDVDAAVQAAIGGSAPTQILENDRRFDFVVRFQPQFRQTPGSDSQYIAAHSQRKQRSTRPSGRRFPSRRRVHDLSREWEAFYSNQIQRARPRFSWHDSRRPSASRDASSLA